MRIRSVVEQSDARFTVDLQGTAAQRQSHSKFEQRGYYNQTSDYQHFQEPKHQKYPVCTN